MGKLKVTKVGMLATIQDEGRYGYRQYGIPQSGAMDVQALHLANRLVRNKQNAPALEVAMQGLTVQAEEKTLISIAGAQVLVQINDTVVEMNQAHYLQREDELKISAPKNGVYFYLAMAGEIAGELAFGSYSTYTMAGFGGMQGRSLQADDVLSATKNSSNSSFTETMPTETGRIRIMKGPEWSLLKDSPDRKMFTVSPSSNRMGIRLDGDIMAIERSEIKSSAVIPGTIQLPPDGHPIVLMKDCQTTGGYPRIAKVLDEDLGRLAQIRAGESLGFIVVENP